MIGDAGRRIALVVALVGVVAAIVEKHSQAGLGTIALRQAAGRIIAVVAAKITKEAVRAIPGEPQGP